MPEHGPAAATETRVALMLAVTAIVAASLAAWATLLTSSAGDAWEQAVRGEVRVSANLVNDTITAYDQVPLAESTMEHRIRAAELARAGAANMAKSHPAIFEQWFIENGEQKLSQNEQPWVRGDGSFDVAARIAALHAREDQGVDPAVRRGEGDSAAHRAWLLGLAVIPAALGFLAATVARAYPGARRVALLAALALVVIAVALGIVGGLVV